MSDHSPQRCVVVGATGHQGGAVARHLVGQGHRVRAMTRRAPADRPPAPGVTFFTGDLHRREDVLRLFQGATHVSVVLPLVYDAQLVEVYASNIAEAARAAGVRRLVYNANTRIPREQTALPAFETRRLAEAILRESGVPLVVLRPPVYLDNLFSPWTGQVLMDDGVLTYPLPAAASTAWVSHADLAHATSAALFTDGVDGQTYDIGGPVAVDGSRLAEEFSEALGRPVRYEALPPTLFEDSLAGLIGARAAAGVAGIYHYMASGADEDLMADDAGRSARALGLRPSRAGDWAAEQPWHIWASAKA